MLKTFLAGPDRHSLVHAALALVHVATAGILLLEGALLHAACAAAAALFYGLLSRAPRPNRDATHGR